MTAPTETAAATELAQSPAEQRAAIRRLTCFDALTGLPNRLLFREQVALVMRLARRNGHPMAVMLADIDDFRRIKNSLGQRGSDRFLRAVATRIGQCLRDSDLVADWGAQDQSRSLARLSGNEFALMLSSLAEAADAQRVAQRLRDVMSEPLTVGGTEVFPTLSVGVALYPGDAEDADALIEHADIALGRAKDLGKDRTQFYSPSMNALATGRLELESALRHAIDDRALFPVYQPCVDGRSGELVGTEALVRWRHPERGVLAPAAFIELAEQSRLIVPIGDIVLEAACRQNRRWQQAGLPAVPVAVNVSAVQVARRDFVSSVARALERSGLAPQWLELEVTESTLMIDAESARQTFVALKSMGVRIAIDDFGTGFSSLSYLRDLPFDLLKIDRSFVRGLPGETRTAGLTCAVVDLARRLSLGVVAEGVETEAQRDYLLANGCTDMQGYLFARPLEAEALEQHWRAKLAGG